MERISEKAGLGSYLGKDIGLVTHILLPLKGNQYVNEIYEITFRNNVILNSKGEGKPFYHLGAIVCIDVGNDIIEEILKTQIKSNAFIKALKKINGQVIDLPKEYLEGLNCTVNKSRKLG